MTRRTRALALGLIAAVATLAAACGDDSDEAGSGSTAPPASADSATDATTAPTQDAPVSGGTVTWLNHTEPASLDPAKARGLAAFDGNLLAPVYDQLVWIAPDGSIEPRLATSVTTDDGTVWSITLREGVTFSDGTPFDAAAVKFNWDRIADPANASPNHGAAATIESAEIMDSLTLKVTLTSPNGQWARYLQAGLGFIASPTAVQASGDEFGRKPVGAGPFTLKEWLPDDHFTFVRNPNYWDAPKPYLDEIVVRPIRDPQQRYSSFVAGEGDFVFYSGSAQQVGELERAGYEVAIPQLSGGIGFVFNTSKPPLDDVRMRQALAYATDLDDFVAKATGGAAEPVKTLFQESSPFYNPDLTQPVNDLAKAQALVDAYIAEHGGPVKINMPVSESIKLYGEVLQQQWSRLDGVEVSVEPIVGAEAQRRQLAGEFDTTTSAVNGIDPEPLFYDYLHSGSSINFGRFASPAVDEALDAGRSSLSVDERKAAYDSLQEALWTEVPYVFLIQAEYATAVGDNIEGYTVVDEGYANFADIWKKP